MLRERERVSELKWQQRAVVYELLMVIGRDRNRKAKKKKDIGKR